MSFLMVVDNSEFKAISAARRTVVPDLQHTKWVTARNTFAKWLRRFGKEDPGSTRCGDFIVDLDWYGIRAFNVSLLSKRMYQHDLFTGISEYLRRVDQSYVATLVGDYPRNPILFKALVTSTDTHFTYGIGGLEQYEEMAKTDATVREWLGVLRPLTR